MDTKIKKLLYITKVRCLYCWIALEQIDQFYIRPYFIYPNQLIISVSIHCIVLKKTVSTYGISYIIFHPYKPYGLVVPQYPTLLLLLHRRLSNGYSGFSPWSFPMLFSFEASFTKNMHFSANSLVQSNQEMTTILKSILNGN